MWNSNSAEGIRQRKLARVPIAHQKQWGCPHDTIREERAEEAKQLTNDGEVRLRLQLRWLSGNPLLTASWSSTTCRRCSNRTGPRGTCTHCRPCSTRPPGSSTPWRRCRSCTGPPGTCTCRHPCSSTCRPRRTCTCPPGSSTDRRSCNRSRCRGGRSSPPPSCCSSRTCGWPGTACPDRQRRRPQRSERSTHWTCSKAGRGEHGQSQKQKAQESRGALSSIRGFRTKQCPYRTATASSSH